MTLDSGLLTIKRPTVTADGGLPQPTYSTVFTGYFAYRTVGYNRYFTALAADDRIDLLVRIQRFAASTKDLVELAPVFPDGSAGVYHIVQVQHLTDDDGLLMTDLSLRRTEGVNDPE